MPSEEEQMEPERENSKAALVGKALGLVILCAGLWWVGKLMNRPASPEDLAKFQKAFGITLLPKQTLWNFPQIDPATRALQKKAVDRVLWEIVASAYQNMGKADELWTQRNQLLSQTTGKASPALTKAKKAELDAKIKSNRQTTQKIEQEWYTLRHLADRCNFRDDGAFYFGEALRRYKKWLETQKPPLGRGGGCFLKPVKLILFLVPAPVLFRPA